MLAAFRSLACVAAAVAALALPAGDPPQEGVGFGSLAGLLAIYPAGSYLLSLDGGALTAQLAFAPLEPDGNVTVTSPANGATGVSATPTIAFTHDCDTCSFLFLEIDGFDTTAGISLETTRSARRRSRPPARSITPS